MLTLGFYSFWVHLEMKEKINIRVTRKLFKKDTQETNLDC